MIFSATKKLTSALKKKTRSGQFTKDISESKLIKHWTTFTYSKSFDYLFFGEYRISLCVLSLILS